jgi:NADH:ubiquinone oxidoreductase subunit 2 (subunit N)
MFTGSVILCSVVSLFLGKHEISLTIIASLLILSAAGSFLQFLAFGECIIKRMRCSLRLMLFGVLFFVLIMIIALIFEWLPKENNGAWLSFVTIFLIAFIGMTRCQLSRNF